MLLSSDIGRGHAELHPAFGVARKFQLSTSSRLRICLSSLALALTYYRLGSFLVGCSGNSATASRHYKVDRA